MKEESKEGEREGGREGERKGEREAGINESMKGTEKIYKICKEIRGKG